MMKLMIKESRGMSALPMPEKQAGVVLVMSLVMLTVLTLIGVTSMTTATLEMKVAGNMQQRNMTFEAAQSRLAFAGAPDDSNPINYLIAIDVTDPDSWPVQTCNVGDGCVNGAEWKATAEVEYKSCLKGVGSSLEAGKGFSTRQFEIKATGENLTGSSRSVQVAAVRYPVKGCGDEML